MVPVENGEDHSRAETRRENNDRLSRPIRTNDSLLFDKADLSSKVSDIVIGGLVSDKKNKNDIRSTCLQITLEKGSIEFIHLNGSERISTRQTNERTHARASVDEWMGEWSY